MSVRTWPGRRGRGSGSATPWSSTPPCRWSVAGQDFSERRRLFDRFWLGRVGQAPPGFQGRRPVVGDGDLGFGGVLVAVMPTVQGAEVGAGGLAFGPGGGVVDVAGPRGVGAAGHHTRAVAGADEAVDVGFGPVDVG